MRYITKLAPALLAAAALAACGGGETKNADPNNTTNNTSNNTTPTNVQNSTTNVCATNTCAPPAASCVGQIALSYSGAGTCDAETGSCSYDAVETRTDCTMSGQSCVGGACVDIDDLCAGVMCDSPPVGPMCDGGTAVSYGAGMCDSASGMCDYTNAEMRTDCTANGMVCSAGACLAPTPAPNPGELIVTEAMPNPAAVGDDLGEWFEIFNNTTRELDLNGLTITDDGGDSFPIPAATPMLAAGAYLVFGNNGDSATNGGVTVDIAYTGISLANSADELVITDAAMVEIDRVAWDVAAGWTIASGASIGFGSQHNTITDDNNDPQFWCSALTAYGDGDFGTPGAANDMCPVPVTVTLYQISNDQDADHPAENSPVVVAGVAITALDATNGYIWLQETAGGQYSGVYVDSGLVDVSAFAVGDVVDIEGDYDEWNGELARITLTTITDTGADMILAPEVLESSVLADIATAELWESVLVQVNEAGVTDTATAASGTVLIDSNILVDDLLYVDFVTNAVECEVYDMIVGPLNYFNGFKILPRDANDIGTSVAATVTTDVSQAAFAFTPAAICVTAGATVTWTNTEAVGHTVTSRLASEESALNANIPATPLFDEVLAANGTAVVTFAEPGTFPYRCRPHEAMEGIVVVPDP